MAKIKIAGAPRKTRLTAKHVAEHRAKAGRDNSPTWEGADKWTAAQFSKQWRSASEYYRMNFNGKDLKPHVLKWMAANDFSKDQIALFKKSKDNRCHPTMGAVAACLLKGMPAVNAEFNNGKDTSAWLKVEIEKVLEEGKNDIDETAAAEALKEAKANGYQPSIQDRMRETAFKMADEIEDAYEAYQLDPESFDPKSYKIVNVLRGKGVKAGHARLIKEFYARDLAELRELASGKGCEQLKEGYSHRPRKHVRKILEFLTEVESACDMLAEEAKVVRKPRAKKPADKAKVVSKLKFKKQDDQLKLVSVNPIDIIGSKELWIYNTKTRKLGKYVAAEYQDLGVKGTTITGFDENKSIQKTLRKPTDQLKAFKDAGKVALRKFLDEINAVDTKLNGRTNEDLVLLKVA